MKKSRLLAVLTALALSATTSWAQTAGQPAARPAARPVQGGPTIALLDVSFVFKQHTRFKSMMEGMKADVERAENQVRAERERLRKSAQQLKDFRRGTQEYKDLEARITKGSADLRVQIELQKKEFLQTEAKIYHNVYQAILQEVDYYVRGKGIVMVLRFNGDPIDPGRAEDVIRGINNPVVWYAKHLDITPIIRDNLNSRAYTPPTSPGGTGQVGRRPGIGVVPFKR